MRIAGRRLPPARRRRQPPLTVAGDGIALRDLLALRRRQHGLLHMLHQRRDRQGPSGTWEAAGQHAAGSPPTLASPSGGDTVSLRDPNWAAMAAICCAGWPPQGARRDASIARARSGHPGSAVECPMGCRWPMSVCGGLANAVGEGNERMLSVPCSGLQGDETPRYRRPGPCSTPAIAWTVFVGSSQAAGSGRAAAWLPAPPCAPRRRCLAAPAAACSAARPSRPRSAWRPPQQPAAAWLWRVSRAGRPWGRQRVVEARAPQCSAPNCAGGGPWPPEGGGGRRRQRQWAPGLAVWPGCLPMHATRRMHARLAAARRRLPDRSRAHDCRRAAAAVAAAHARLLPSLAAPPLPQPRACATSPARRPTTATT